MSNERLDEGITRERLVDAFRPLAERGDPFDVMNDGSDAGEKLASLHTTWGEAELRRIASLPLEERVRADIAFNTVFIEAGFTDITFLEDVIDNLMNTLSMADNAHRRDLASEVKAKIHEIEKKIQEQDPAYETTDFGGKDSWNPLRTASPAEFYADYAYWIWPQPPSVDEAVAAYQRFHKDCDLVLVKQEMEKIASDGGVK